MEGRDEMVKLGLHLEWRGCGGSRSSGSRGGSRGRERSLVGFGGESDKAILSGYGRRLIGGK